MSLHDRKHTNNDNSAAEVAAEWIVRLSADDPLERAAVSAGFAAWKKANPQNAAVAADMESFVGQIAKLGIGSTSPEESKMAPSRRAARAALNAVLNTGSDHAKKRPASRRIKRAGAVIALALVLMLPFVMAIQFFSSGQLLADFRTAKGEQRSEILTDGTRLTLSSASAVNYRQDARQRRLELLSGEVFVDVAKDTERVFIVETPHGYIRALGTRFIVRRDADSTRLAMLESRTAVSTRQQGIPGDPFSGTAQIVEAGEAVRVSDAGIEALAPIQPDMLEQAFKQQRLVVRDRALPEVLDELARYRAGLIHYEQAAIKDIRITAVLPLDDTGRALQLLATNFPQLRVRTFTPWVVWVDSNI